MPPSPGPETFGRGWMVVILATAMVMPLSAVAQDPSPHAAAPSGQGDIEIRNGTIAGGGGDIAAARFQLTGSFGEPVTGTVAAEGFELTAGFPATLNKPNQIIFADGFEPTDEQP